MKKQTKTHPLVVPIQFLLLLGDRGLNTRIPGVTFSFPRIVYNGVGGMDPTERVQHVFRNIFCVYAVYGVPYVLSCRQYETKGNQNEHRDRIMQPKHRRINVDVADSNQGLETAKDIQHGSSSRTLVDQKRFFVPEWCGHGSELLPFHSSTMVRIAEEKEQRWTLCNTCTFAAPHHFNSLDLSADADAL